MFAFGGISAKADVILTYNKFLASRSSSGSIMLLLRNQTGDTLILGTESNVFAGFRISSGAVKTKFTNSILPNTNKNLMFGSTEAAWDSIYTDDLINVADIPFLDGRDDVADLQGIRGSGVIDPTTELELVDDNTLPKVIMVTYQEDSPAWIDTTWREEQIKEDSTIVEYVVPVDSTGALNEVSPVYEYVYRTERTVDKIVLVPAHVKGDLIKGPDGKPFYSIRPAIGQLQGAIRQLDNERITLSAWVYDLEQRVDSLRTEDMLKGVRLDDLAARVAKLEGR